MCFLASLAAYVIIAVASRQNENRQPKRERKNRHVIRLSIDRPKVSLMCVVRLIDGFLMWPSPFARLKDIS